VAEHYAYYVSIANDPKPVIYFCYILLIVAMVIKVIKPELFNCLFINFYWLWSMLWICSSVHLANIIF